MAKILHCADFHLDSPLESLKPELAAQREREIRQSVRDVIRLANEEKVEILLISGDVFDRQNAFYDTALFVAEELRKTPARVFIAPGNHDALIPSSPYRAVKWPDNVRIFEKNQIEKVECADGVAVYGAGFTGSAQDNPLLEGFYADAGDRVRLMVLHGDLESPASRYNPVSIKQIEKSNLSYLALGHVHAHSGIQKAGQTVYAYSGCLEGRGFDEQGEKGVILGEVTENKSDLRFVPMSKRQYKTLEIDISAAETKETLAKLVLDCVPVSAAQDIYKLILVGKTGIEINAPALERGIGKYFYDVKLIDSTRRKEDLWALCGEDSLKGIFLRKMRERYDKAENDEERASLVRTTSMGIAALENRRLSLYGSEEAPAKEGGAL